jgi:hypothetical protein
MRESPDALLRQHSIYFEPVRNPSIHQWMVRYHNVVADFWPRTERWVIREAQPAANGRGVDELIAELKRIGCWG